MIIAATTIATALYLLLTLAALLSIVSPALQSLSSHGKTRMSSNINSKNNKHHHRTQQNNGGYQKKLKQFILTSPRLTIGKARFIDFYTCGIISTILLLAYAYTTIAFDVSIPIHNCNNYHDHQHQLIPTFLLLTHLIRRYCECKWVQKSNSSSKMHLTGYLLGIVHYICLPFILVAPQSYCYNSCKRSDGNKNSNAHNDGSKSYDEVSDSTSLFHDTIQYTTVALDICAIIGCMYFQYQQHKHHVILANLRNKNNAKPKSNYSIPAGGWFKYISCPHYLAEIMIYLMFAILLMNDIDMAAGEDEVRAWLHPKGLDTCIVSMIVAMHRWKFWLLLLWVISNLSISANRTHSWYLDNYGEVYPNQRRRLIPFVW